MQIIRILVLVLFGSIHDVFSWEFSLPKFKLSDAVCLVKECCAGPHIPADFNALEKSLNERVFGQPLVKEVVSALRSHFRFKSEKALTLSFHGWQGSGKNFVSSFIAESIYKYGMKSQFVHVFTGRIHFPQGGNVELYKRQLYSWLKGNITNCERQLFIFDEVDKMPPGVLNAIKPMIDYRNMVDGVDYTKAVFIFLSNTGASLINQQFLDYWKQGRNRNDLSLVDFEHLISQGAFNEEGGFYRSDTIKDNLIDHYIPFLPMEEKHVRQCIGAEFKARGVDNPKVSHMDEVFNYIDFGPDPEKIFSKTGCKRISQKVGNIVVKYYQPRDDL